MGHKISRRKRPHRGSLQFWPHKRSKRTTARIRKFPEISEVKPLLFAGYKSGMTHVIAYDNRKISSTRKKEISIPVTVIECPPIKIVGIRFYEKTPVGIKVLTQYLMKNEDNFFKRLLSPIKKDKDLNKIIEENKDKIHDLTLYGLTQPNKIGFKKKPELIEIGLGGSINEKIEYAKENLGKELRVSDVFEEKEEIDVASITKGKGFQGSVKRFHVKLLQNKAEKNRRKVGSLGSWHPAKTSYRTPQHGQLGYFARTEHNKVILKIGDKPEEVNPEGGFLKYGFVKNDYLLLKGSVPGPVKRLIKLRTGKRTSGKLLNVSLIEISRKSKQ